MQGEVGRDQGEIRARSGEEGPAPEGPAASPTPPWYAKTCGAPSTSGGSGSTIQPQNLASMQIFFQGHYNFYFYFLFISQAQAEIFRPIFLASRYHFSKFCRGCESEGRVDSVRARPRLRARLGGSEDSWWAFGEAVCVGASS